MNHIPDTHLDLIDGPYVVALSTSMPDGQPQTTPVWCNRKGDYIFINVMKGLTQIDAVESPAFDIVER